MQNLLLEIVGISLISASRLLSRNESQRIKSEIHSANPKLRVGRANVLGGRVT